MPDVLGSGDALAPPDDPTYAAAADKALAGTMTHQSEKPNPAAPYLQGVRDIGTGMTRFMHGGLTEAVPGLRGAMPAPINAVGNVFQSQAARDALSTANAGGLIQAFVPVGGARMGWPDIGQPAALEKAANLNKSFAERAPEMAARNEVLQKLIANNDFKPEFRDGRMRFRTLTKDENDVMNRIGWSRSPNVSWEDETAEGLRSRWAWEHNIRHWLSLSQPE